MKTILLLGALTGLGRALGGPGGMLIAAGCALVLNAGVYRFADTLVLRMAGARAVTPAEAPALHTLIEELAWLTNIPGPQLYVVEAEAPNAFATGRTPAQGAIAVTSGLLRILDHAELASVIAHELEHIKHRDTLPGAVAATAAGALTLAAGMARWPPRVGGEEQPGIARLSRALLMLLLAPVAAGLIRLASSRARAFRADAAGACSSGDPVALAAALRKLETGSARGALAINPATAHLYIVNPLRGGMARLFCTHPPIGQRIARLEQLALGHRALI